MKKSDMIQYIAKSADISIDDAENALNAIGDEIGNALSSGDCVRIVGFGKFFTRERPEREGRHPSTGELITIKQSKLPTFKPFDSLKALCN